MVPHDDSSEPDLRNYPDVMRRRWKVLAVAVLVVVGVALAASLTQAARYRAESEVLVRQPPSSTSLASEPLSGTMRALANEVRQAQAPALLDAVRDTVGDEPNLGVRADGDADVLHFTAESSDPAVAAAAADRYAEEFVTQRRDAVVAQYAASGDVVEELTDELDAQIADAMVDGAVAEVAGLEAQRQRYHELLADLTLSSQLAQGGMQVIRPAEVPEAPFEPTTTRNVMFALVVGLVLGVGAAALFERLDDSLRDEYDLRAASGGIPNLAVVPEANPWGGDDRALLVTREEPESAAAEAYRNLRASVQFLGIDRTLSTIAFTSVSSGDGASTTAANLAVVCARAGQRVVLVDCDLRAPRVHEFFGIDNHTGFTTVLLGEASLEAAAHRIDDEPGLVVITSGPVPPDPAELLSGKRARSLIGSVAAQADLVIVDSPAVLPVADPLIVSGMVDGMVLVARSGLSERDEVARAMEQLGLVDAPVLGTVLNRHAGRTDSNGSRVAPPPEGTPQAEPDSPEFTAPNGVVQGPLSSNGPASGHSRRNRPASPMSSA